jgi:hypothetical protein
MPFDIFFDSANVTVPLSRFMSESIPATAGTILTGLFAGAIVLAFFYLINVILGRR